MRRVLLVFILFSSLYADEYDFDMGAIEQDPYEYSGYLRLEDKAQRLNPDEDLQNLLHLEGLLDFTYDYEMLKFKTSLMGTYDYIESKLNNTKVSLNELSVEAKLNANNTILVGKESLKWGKGYYFNPVAFFDRPKDPNQPTLGREGFVVAKYNYNKSMEGALKNLSFDFVYLPTTDDVNSEYNQLATENKNSNNIAARLYMLLYDTDIDIIYNYSDTNSNKIGLDFSKNLQTNFEVHGEYAQVIDGGYDYLLGIRYLTDFELTIISEYLYQSEGLGEQELQISNSNLPFVAKDYFITLVTQKEPFDILYSAIYYKNMTNMQDISMQNKVGIAYSFKNNIDTDLSYNINSGSKLSEFNKKLVKDFLWLRLTWSF